MGLNVAGIKHEAAKSSGHQCQLLYQRATALASRSHLGNRALVLGTHLSVSVYGGQSEHVAVACDDSHLRFQGNPTATLTTAEASGIVEDTRATFLTPRREILGDYATDRERGPLVDAIQRTERWSLHLSLRHAAIHFQLASLLPRGHFLP